MLQDNLGEISMLKEVLMQDNQKELQEKLTASVTLTDTVNKKVEEAYAQIRRQSANTKIVKYRKPKRRLAVVAACVAIMGTSVIALAATGFFNKEEKVEEGTLTYKFDINYDLKPGVFKVTPSYVPEGYDDHGDGKYWSKENYGHGFSLIPIQNTADLDDAGKMIQECNVEKVEHTTLSGMEADIVTFKDAEKYERPTEIFLFNANEGYVLEVWGDYNVSEEELKKVADNLTITRTGDDAFTTEEEKQALAEEEAKQKEYEEQEKAKLQAACEKGVSKENVIPLGKSSVVENLTGEKTTYTVESAEFTDKLDNVNKDNFYDYSVVEPWLNEDGTLKPYLRQHIMEDGTEEEEEMGQCFLRVKVKVEKEISDKVAEKDLAYAKDTSLNAFVRPFGKDKGDAYEWIYGMYAAAPGQHNEMQMDHSALYLDKPEFTGADVRNHFFYRNMKDGETLEYELIFVVDKDLKDKNPMLAFMTGAQDPRETYHSLF